MDGQSLSNRKATKKLNKSPWVDGMEIHPQTTESWLAAIRPKNSKKTE
jgi:hypothetical protein